MTKPSGSLRTFDFEPEIDLFASNLNYQVESYISQFRDLMQASLYIDTFSIETRHTNEKFYTFPSFSLLGGTLAKIQYETTKQVES